MEINELNDADLESLSALIKEVYLEYPVSMHFESEPDGDQLKELFDKKIGLIRDGNAISYVARHDGKIIGECEIVRTDKVFGALGIILRKQMRSMGIGGELLVKSLRKARVIGIKSVYAEVDKNNKRAINFFLKNGFSTGSEGSADTMVLEFDFD